MYIHMKSEVDMARYGCGVAAGFPSPADDYLERSLDLNELLVNHPDATYFLKVEGDSMVDAGIFDGDIVLVDRSLEVKSGDVVIASIYEGFTIKRLIIDGDRVRLRAENRKYKEIDVKDPEAMEVWGKVIFVIHKL